jgi:hypothetical protein
MHSHLKRNHVTGADLFWRHPLACRNGDLQSIDNFMWITRKNGGHRFHQ